MTKLPLDLIIAQERDQLRKELDLLNKDPKTKAFWRRRALEAEALMSSSIDDAAERDRLREINAELVAALEKLHERCRIDATMEGPVFMAFNQGKLAGRTATEDFRHASSALAKARSA